LEDVRIEKLRRHDLRVASALEDDVARKSGSAFFRPALEKELSEQGTGRSEHDTPCSLADIETMSGDIEALAVEILGGLWNGKGKRSKTKTECWFCLLPYLQISGPG
jgi:hypothetical protein